MNNQLKVNIDNNQAAVKVPKGTRMLVRRCCRAVLNEESQASFDTVKIVFTENEGLKDLSGKNIAQDGEGIFVRQSHKTEPENSEHLGEVYISLENALQNSQTYNNSFDSEVVFLIAHGVYLLLGYKDSGNFEKDVLQEKEKRIIQTMGMKYYVH